MASRRKCIRCGEPAELVELSRTVAITRRGRDLFGTGCFTDERAWCAVHYVQNEQGNTLQASAAVCPFPSTKPGN